MNKLYNNQNIRLVGIKLDSLTNNSFHQISIFDETNHNKREKSSKLDNVIDTIKDKYGYDSITLGSIIKKD